MVHGARAGAIEEEAHMLKHTLRLAIAVAAIAAAPQADAQGLDFFGGESVRRANRLRRRPWRID